MTHSESIMRHGTSVPSPFLPGFKWSFVPQEMTKCSTEFIVLTSR